MTLIGLSLLLFAGIAAILLFLVYISYPRKSLVQERIESLKPHVEDTIVWDVEPNRWQKILGRLGKNGESFLPFLKRKLQKKEKQDSSKNDTERLKYIIDAIENGTGYSKKYNF